MLVAKIADSDNNIESLLREVDEAIRSVSIDTPRILPGRTHGDGVLAGQPAFA